MRQYRILSLISACALSAATLHGASYSEVRERVRPGEQMIQEIRFSDVLSTPQAFINTRVRFRCMFVQSGNFFDPQHTYFKPYTHSNLIVWDDRAAIWDPQVRAKPLTSVYLSKDRIDASSIATLNKYQYLELVGEVAMVLEGVPFISLHSIKSINEGGTFTDTAVYHVQQAVDLGTEAEQKGTLNLRALAEDHFHAALGQDLPTVAKVTIGHLRGQNLLLAGDFAGCAKVMKDVITAAELDRELDRRQLASMHFLYAKALVELEGTNDQAVAHARTAVALDPEAGDAYAVLGITLAGTGQFDEARRQCEKAIRLRPNNAEVRWYLGRILDQQEAYDEAVEALRRAIDLTPKDNRLHKAIAATYLHRGQKANNNTSITDFSSALQEFGIAVRLNAADAEAIFGEGLVLENATARKITELTVSGNPPTKVQPSIAAAVGRYKASIAADGSFLPARRSLAGYYRAANKPDEAIAQYKGIIDIDPTRAESWTDLGTYLWSLDKKDETFDVYQRFVKTNSDSEVAKLTLATTAVAVDKSAEALLLTEKILATSPGNAQAWLVQAKAQLALGQAKDARKSANKALDLFPDAEGKAQAKQVYDQAEAALNAK